MNKVARKWLRQALHDLEMAQKNIPIQGYDVAAFLSHQAVEKLLKAVYALRDRKVPKTHHIDELARGLGLQDELIHVMMELTIDYTFSRYPDVGDLIPFEAYDEKIATGKVKIAEQVFEALAGEFQPLLGEDNG
ncbi:MAG: HEPN domain-containing protein [Candidatus Zixiibacteriota bacterium]|nr:MAG: HEPN domain-containing protein [candidate division Zixibacteria bacterium]